MKDHITIEGHDGAFAAYIARPKTSPAPAVVVLQLMTETRAQRTSRTPSIQYATSRSATAELPSSAIASAG